MLVEEVWRRARRDVNSLENNLGVVMDSLMNRAGTLILFMSKGGMPLKNPFCQEGDQETEQKGRASLDLFGMFHLLTFVLGTSVKHYDASHSLCLFVDSGSKMNNMKVPNVRRFSVC